MSVVASGMLVVGLMAVGPSSGHGSGSPMRSLPSAAAGAMSLSGRRRCLHGQVGRKETDRASSQLRSELGARLTKELTGDQSRRKDCGPEFAKVRGVLDERIGVPVSLEDEALGLIVAEVDLVLH